MARADCSDGDVASRKPDDSNCYQQSRSFQHSTHVYAKQDLVSAGLWDKQVASMNLHHMYLRFSTPEEATLTKTAEAKGDHQNTIAIPSMLIGASDVLMKSR